MSGIDSLHQKIDKLLASIEQQQEQAVEFQCYWADESVPAGSGRIIVTDWSSGALDEQED